MMEEIVRYLKSLVSEESDDMASVQINTDGKVILRVGLSASKHYSIEQFEQILSQSRSPIDSDNTEK